MDATTEKMADMEVSNGKQAGGFGKKKSFDQLQKEFGDIAELSNNEQAEFFLKSFVFDLGDNWKEVITLTKTFQAYLEEKAEKHDLDPVQAADFLQKQGRTRTAMQRRAELKDIDLDMNDRICLIEYLVLHYKIMILEAYFKRHEKKPTVSLENEGVGLVDVGPMLLEEVMTLPVGMSEELRKAIEDFMAKKAAKDKKVKELKAKVEQGGVKGLTAKNELFQLEAADTTEDNRIEITLAAAKRRSKGTGGAEALAAKKKEQERLEAEKKAASKAKLAARAKMFEQ